MLVDKTDNFFIQTVDFPRNYSRWWRTNGESFISDKKNNNKHGKPRIDE